MRDKVNRDHADLCPPPTCGVTSGTKYGSLSSTKDLVLTEYLIGSEERSLLCAMPSVRIHIDIKWYMS
jgi:hypothetical protein